MGLLDSVKDAVAGGSDGDEELEEQFAQELEDEKADVVEEEPDPVETTEQVQQEWDTAYQFAEEMLEVDGFANMMDFTEKYMFYKVQR